MGEQDRNELNEVRTELQEKNKEVRMLSSRIRTLERSNAVKTTTKKLGI